MKIYLASPYSHPVKAVRSDRFRAACKVAANIINQGHICFSPIAHSHHIADYMENHNDSGYWLKQDMSFLESWADEVWVLMLDGWKESKGIAVEVTRAVEIGIHVKYLAVRQWELSQGSEGLSPACKFP